MDNIVDENCWYEIVDDDGIFILPHSFPKLNDACESALIEKEIRVRDSGRDVKLYIWKISKIKEV